MCPQRLLTLQVRSSVRQTILLELVIKGSIDKNLSFLADVLLSLIQNMKEICSFLLFAHNDKK